MIIVRNTFTAKPGQAGQLAKRLKEMAEAGGLQNARVLTDLVGSFNTVVLEHEVESAGAFEENLARYSADAALREKAAAYLDLWITGKRELLRVV
ncbi:MAG: hypothetical protein R2748_27380 [Bryobacterales bacterium]